MSVVFDPSLRLQCSDIEPIATVPEFESTTALSQRRVLHIGKFYPPHVGGMETHVQSLCKELRRDFNIEVIVSNYERRTTVETIDNVKVTRAGTLLNFAAAPVC